MGTPMSWQDWDQWRTKWITSFQDDDTEHRQAGRQTQTLSTYCHCLLNVPAPVHICVCINANASGEIMPWGLSCPRSVGTSLSFHRYRSLGQRQTDRQSERQSIICSLVQRFSNPHIPNEKHIDSCFSTSKDFDPETPTRELAMIENSL